MKFMLTTICSVMVAILLLLVVFTPPKCEHTERVEHFVFASQNSTASSYVEHYCAECDNSLGYNLFNDVPSDSSWLDVIKEKSDSDEIVSGGYYTMTAIVTLGDYDHQRTRVRCRVESGNNIVYFSADFNDDLEDVIKSVQEDDEITFRGKFYEIGCGFEDCELINKEIK